MNYRHSFAIVAAIAALAAGTAAPSVGAATETAEAAAATTGTPIVYSELYLKLLALYPSGWVMDSCGARYQVTRQGGVCLDSWVLEYFYPDGSFGRRSWYVDASSPTGWSIAPDPCIGLSDEEGELWAWHVDWVNGYYETGPDLTSEQIERYGACWDWWF